ncbi:hypothetical protein [Amycolatopsis sp. NPDC051371]|uniref:hypothetical protein n=1 Tax=Amycolatopsis sp. NPDC051371 TaxID=3155800 RepID=UPI0034164356
MKAYELRQDTYLLAAGVLYAVAAYLLQKDVLAVSEAVKAMDSFSFSRTKKVNDPGARITQPNRKL